jgi:NHLM bacteriocin system ABC transporter ATP-binding protein
MDRTWISAEGGVAVTGGQADLFAHRPGADGQPTRRHFVARIEDGGIIPALPDGPLAIEAVPLPGTTLRHVPPGPLAAGQVPAVDTALLAIANSVRATGAPRDATILAPHQILSAAPGTTLMGNSSVWWLRIVGGAVRINGRGVAPGTAGADLIVLSGRDWIEVETACTIETMSSADLVAAGLLDRALTAYLRRLLAVIDERVTDRDAASLAAIDARKASSALVVGDAARGALRAVGARAVYSVRPAARAEATELRYQRVLALMAAVVGQAGPALAVPADRTRLPATDEDAVRDIARSSGLHLRDVDLPADWHRRDCGPLIGWRETGDEVPAQAAALVFRRGRYHLVDPLTGQSTRLTRATARGLRMSATQVQVPLPAGTGIGALLRFGASGVARDVRGMLIAGVLAACLGLAVPLGTGTVLGHIAASSSPGSELRLLPLLLAIAATLSALASIAQNTYLLRVEGRAENGAQLALWDRLIRLPVTFFRTTSSGELANAVLGLSFIRESLNGLTVQMVGAALTGLLDLALILTLSVPIGLAALGVVVVCLGALVILGRRVSRYSRAALPDEGRSVALTNKLLTGIARLKVAGAEDRAYAQWSQRASRARADLIAVRRIQATAMALSTVLPVAGQVILFLVIAGPLGAKMPATQFFTVNVAFTALLGMMLILLSAGIEVFAAAPRLSVLAPVITARPERRLELVDPGDLRGEISLVGVSFAYAPDAPLVLENLSLHVSPGEFVAVVGPSGCGKSTLLRLLLGFDSPSMGAVLYDGQDLADLDPQAIRRQCGIVLQDGILFPGSIRENICGAGNFSLKEVWAAAQLAGIDEDIKKLPMKLETLLPPGGGTLSGGQRQRILIARALIHRPRILLFDEATSALDNRTQDIVTASTRALAATRLVIAHRLSTIVDADRIIVLDKGTVAQAGTYAELMGQPGGLFYQLAARQLATTPPVAAIR